jgi:asparagine synthase (glutamine-hydrolysing)
MCGITGLFRLNGQPIDPFLLKQMHQAIKHRGGDGEGIFIDRDVGIAHHRLRIIGGEQEGRQPMHADSRYHFVFNGTLFNYRQLAQILKSEKIRVHDSSDSEVAFSWLMHFGIGRMKDWNGMFSFIFYDALKKTIWIRRDPLGIKPLYMAYLNGYLAFSSETKSFFHFPDWTFAVEKEKINLFLRFGEREIKGQPFWKKAEAVPIGGTLTLNCPIRAPFSWCFETDRVEPPNPTILPQKHGSFEEAVHQGRILFEDALNTHTSETGLMALSLSGGLDSSLILCFLKYLFPQKIPLVLSYSELEFRGLNLLKNHFTADYHFLPALSWEEFQQIHREVIALSEGPLPGPNAVYHFQLYSFARKLGVAIMLSGQGADELFLGYPGYLPAYWADLHAEKKYARLFSEILWTSLMRRDLYRHSLPHLTGRKTEYAHSRTLSLLAQRDYSLFHSNLPYLLHAEDRHSLANHIEARVPFLDCRFQAFARSLPAEYSLYQGKQKRILRAIGKDLLPDKILNRNSKHGFSAKIPDLNPKEKWNFYSQLKAFIQQQKYGDMLPTRNPALLFHRFPALTWRINSLQMWKKMYPIDD